MLSGNRYRIYPTKEQQQKLAIQFGCARWVYNEARQLRIDYYKETTEFLSYNAIATILTYHWKPCNEWLYDADSQVLQQSLRNMDRAFTNFFQKRSKFPRRKKRHSKQSIQYPQRVRLNIEDSLVYLPKVGWTKIKLHRECNYTIKTVTITKTATGKYFASILTDDKKVREFERTNFNEDQIVGIDVGIKDFAIDSNSNKIANPKFLKTALPNLRRKQKKLSRKIKGSNRKNDARLAVAKAHEKVANARSDFHHKQSFKLANENQVVSVENLNIKGMVKNHKLARSISDVVWGQFYTFLGYKLERKGGRLVRIDRWYPSSKTCNQCNYKNNELTLDVRTWTCPTCNTVLDRDVNAAINIKKQGILILKTDGCTVSARRGLCKTSILEAAACEA